MPKFKNIGSWLVNTARKFKKFAIAHVDTALDVGLAISMIIPAMTMLLGLKAIPNIVATSVSSIAFAYLWVGLLAVGGFALLAFIVLRNSPKPVLKRLLMNVAYLGIIFGVLIYGLSAWTAFGFLSAQVTLGVCFGLATLVLARWLQARRIQKFVSRG